ncbi:MAG: hypothetical protein IJ766_00045 [Clostridia bacterium]|nr:hypothetical protein [Clostridia bacterium]
MIKKSTNKTDRIIQMIAQENGVSPFQVRADMTYAINYGFNSPDPETRAFWKGVPHKGKVPTIDEFLTWISKKYASKPV